MSTFADLGIRSRTLSSLTSQGILELLPIQERAIPTLFAGRDAVIQAPTGSGKTLGFMLPLVERLGGHAAGGPRSLIVAPTRELAAQLAAVAHDLDGDLHIALLIGGVGYGRQLSALGHQPDLVIGCPGRILDLADRGSVGFSGVRTLVIDEADEMLNQGFARDVERIIALTPHERSGQVRQSVLASATMPEWVQRMVRRHLTDPVSVSVSGEQEPDLEHGLVRVGREQRLLLLSRVLQRHSGSAIVFHRTKHGVRKLSRDLNHQGHRSTELQGNLSQNARDRAIGDFRSRRSDVLVATNVAARGLDIEHVGLVVNYELPETAEWLTHRVGRTARNGAKGRALTFVDDGDTEQWRKLRRGGAPDLPWVDIDELLETGRIRTPAEPAGEQPTPRSPAIHVGRTGDAIRARVHRDGAPHTQRQGQRGSRRRRSSGARGLSRAPSHGRLATLKET
jgi:superfamily II DNA/RNA helicase